MLVSRTRCFVERLRRKMPVIWTSILYTRRLTTKNAPPSRKARVSPSGESDGSDTKPAYFGEAKRSNVQLIVPEWKPSSAYTRHMKTRRFTHPHDALESDGVARPRDETLDPGLANGTLNRFSTLMNKLIFTEYNYALVSVIGPDKPHHHPTHDRPEIPSFPARTGVIKRRATGYDRILWETIHIQFGALIYALTSDLLLGTRYLMVIVSGADLPSIVSSKRLPAQIARSHVGVPAGAFIMHPQLASRVSTYCHTTFLSP
jgi:hypothetical protein